MLLHCNANERKRIPRRLFLSFDDGPSPNYTDTLLDLLAGASDPCILFCCREIRAEEPAHHGKNAMRRSFDRPAFRRARQRLFDDTCICGAGFPKITDNSS